MAEEDDRPKGPPSIVDGKLARSSVSQMQKADGCIRQWRYAKVDKLPDKPPGAGQKRGTKGHGRIETFLKDNDRTALDHLELVGFQKGLIPVPGKDLLVEHPFAPEGAPPTLHALHIPLTGYIDLVNPRRVAFEKVLVLRDWKFKKPWNGKLGYDADDLINPNHEAGIQMIGYGEWARRNAGLFGPFDKVELSHVTFQTEGRADVVEASRIVTLDYIAKAWETISRRIIPRMEAAVLAPTARDVEADGERKGLCDAYGGCPFKSTCHDRMARIVAGFKKAPQTGVTEMGKMSSILGPAAPSTPTAEAPAEIKVRKLVIEDVEFTAAQAIQGTSYTVNGVNAKFLCNTDMAGTTFASFMPLAGGAPLLVPGETAIKELPVLLTMPYADKDPIVLPPDAPKSDPALAAKPAPGTLTVPTTPKVTETALGNGDVLVVSSTPAPVVEALVAEKKPRTKKAVTVEGVITSTTAAPTAAGVERFLYFGCAPVGVVTSTLHAYVDGLDKTLQKEAQIDILDLRTAGDQVFGFGKWKGFIAKAALLTPPPAGHYVVTPGDERIDCVANALASVSQVVIGGGR